VKQRPLVLNVADLLRQPAHRRAVNTSLTVAELGIEDSRLRPDEDIVVDVVLESMTEGIIVAGTVAVPWHSECRRCLTPIDSVTAGPILELFSEHPIDEDQFPVVGEQIDLEPIVREAAMLDLPLAPLCRPDCQGLCPECGADRNELDCGHHGRPTDIRWGALEALKAQLAEESEPN
jgi:uncharacterized protein